MSAATIPELVREVAARGDRLAVSDGEQQIGCAALAAAVEEVARAWLALGIERGDRVALWAPNSWRWQLAALGAQAAGAVLVPLNTRWKGREAADVLLRSRARALVTVVGFLGCDYVAALRAAEIALPALETVVVADGAAPAGTLAWREFLDGAATITPADAAHRARTVTPDDYSDLVFTAGTTGQPKGVACTHAQTIRVFTTWSEIVGLEPSDRYLVVNPYFHTFGYKAGWLACLISGAVCLPQAVFSVDEVLARVARERVTVLPGPPTLYQSILAHPERQRHDLSSLRLAVTGAAIVPLELIRRMRRELTFATILTAYGLTEACGVVTMCRRDDDDETIARTSGRAIPGLEVRVDANGEVRARGYNVMRSYWEDDAPAVDGKGGEPPVDGDGWLHTGDVGVLDERGNLRITDRLKDLYIVGGFNVSPAEVEQLLHTHPSVAQAAVVGAPDERLGEIGYAFVVPRPDTSLEPEALIEWARARLANYKVPRHVAVVSSLPLSAVGKVLKQELRVRAARALQAP
jgi:acyl-CoA synthetase (AMP-forming)/AMP-acid ligase II